MPAKKDVTDALRNLEVEVVSVSEGVPHDRWAAETYEEGWNCRQLLAHIASTSGVAGFVLTLAKAGAAMPPIGDNDEFNRRQVALREGKSVEDVLGEVRATIERDVQAVVAADDALLQQHFVAPWGNEGTVAQVIIDSVNGHLGGHVADLRGGLRG